ADFEARRARALGEEQEAAARTEVLLQRRGRGHAFGTEGHFPEHASDRARDRVLRAGARPDGLERRFGAFAEALRVQFGALWQEEVHRRDRRDTAFGVLRRGAVPGPFEFVFGFDRRTLAVEVARALEAAAARFRNRDRLGL